MLSCLVYFNEYKENEHISLDMIVSYVISLNVSPKQAEGPF